MAEYTTDPEFQRRAGRWAGKVGVEKGPVPLQRFADFRDRRKRAARVENRNNTDLRPEAQ